MIWYSDGVIVAVLWARGFVCTRDQQYLQVSMCCQVALRDHTAVP